MKNFGYKFHKENPIYGFFLFEHPLYPCQFAVVKEMENIVIRPIIAELTKKAYFFAYGKQFYINEFRGVKDDDKVPKWVITYIQSFSLKNPIVINLDIPEIHVDKFYEVLQGRQILLEHQLDIVSEWLSNQ